MYWIGRWAISFFMLQPSDQPSSLTSTLVAVVAASAAA